MANTFPINLIVKQRKCLVVGGGKVALRKMEKLSSAGADVKVVALESSAGVREFARDHDISLHERPFEASDVDGMFLVYAATNDRSLNAKIITLAQEVGILVCAVDRNWSDGSFITPASVRTGELTVSVSTQGVACRKTKLVKENLARHIETVENMGILVMGADHNFLPLKTRESRHLVGDRLMKTGEMIMNLWGVQEFAILNTCNRVELVAVAHADQTLIDLLTMILKFDALELNQYYVKTSYEAFKHLCFVAAGLYSQTPGENHITAQFKDACAVARRKNWAASALRGLENNVLHVSKHIRNETSDSLKGLEVEDIALTFVFSKVKKLKERKVVVAGTGTTGSRVKDILVDEGCDLKWLYHSKRPREKTPGVTVSRLDDLRGLLPETDLLITALSFDGPYIGAEYGECLKEGAMVIDLGMPRNVSGELRERRKDARFIDIEDLKHWHRRENGDMERVFAIAEELVEEHRDLYEKFIGSFIDGRQGERAVRGSD